MDNSNRIKNRDEFKKLVDKLQHGEKIKRIRRTLLEEHYDEPYEQAEALLDVLMGEIDFKTKQVLMVVIYLAAFELGRGRFIKDDQDIERVLDEVRNKPDTEGDFEKKLAKTKKESN
jgi:hypothetical protein